MSDNDLEDMRTKCHLLVYGHFKDLKKTLTWFETRNPLLGNYTPNHMLKFRTEKLLKFIETQLAENVLTQST